VHRPENPPSRCLSQADSVVVWAGVRGNHFRDDFGPAGGRYDLGTKPRSRAAYRRFIVPLSG
jgi:hypothetical protein